MGPFLLVWALPTVFLYSLLLALYKGTGLIEWINLALGPLLLPFGITGRDAVRILMGLGCNVPAVVSTRSCSGCTRKSTIYGIAYGSMCSYQLQAAVAVFAAAGKSWLGPVYVIYLTITTLIYLRLMKPRDIGIEVLKSDNVPHLRIPEWSYLTRSLSASMGQFLRTALPIFFLICLTANYLSDLGVFSGLASHLEKPLYWLGIPMESALPIIMASVRKDGSLLSSPEIYPLFNEIELLASVYLASVALPCLVTVLTIFREIGLRPSILLIARQLLASLVFTESLVA